MLSHAQAQDACGCKHHAVVIRPLRLRDTGFDVAADGQNRDVPPAVDELRRASWAARSDTRTLRQIQQAAIPTIHENVSCVLSFQYGDGSESGWLLRWEILQAMHGKVYPVIEQGPFDG